MPNKYLFQLLDGETEWVGPLNQSIMLFVKLSVVIC